jgi:hypothetical protein
MMVCVLVRGLVGLVVVLLDVPLLVLNTGLGEMIPALGSRGTTDHVFPLVVLVLLPWDMGKFGVKGMMFANPSFEQMARHWFNFLCANASVESLAHSRSCF